MCVSVNLERREGDEGAGRPRKECPCHTFESWVWQLQVPFKWFWVGHWAPAKLQYRWSCVVCRVSSVVVPSVLLGCC